MFLMLLTLFFLDRYSMGRKKNWYTVWGFELLAIGNFEMPIYTMLVVIRESLMIVYNDVYSGT